MTASSAGPGTLSLLQLAAVSQSPPIGLIQVTVERSVRLSTTSRRGRSRRPAAGRLAREEGELVGRTFDERGGKLIDIVGASLVDEWLSRRAFGAQTEPHGSPVASLPSPSRQETSRLVREHRGRASVRPLPQAFIPM